MRYYLKGFLKDEKKKSMHISGGWGGHVLGRRMWENPRFTEEVDKAPGSGRIPRRAVNDTAREAGSGTWKTLQVIAVTF